MKKKIDKNKTNYSLAHVLYQKLGTDWYAFTEKDGDCFVTKVDHKATNPQPSQAEARAKRRAA